MSWIVRVRCATGLSEPVTTLANIHNCSGISETATPSRHGQVEILAGFGEFEAADRFAAEVADAAIESSSIEQVRDTAWAQTEVSTVVFGDRTLRLEVGTAFGHGAHPTTLLALTALADIARPVGTTVLDVGCGTGVLSIAAATRGFTATGCDIDPAAVAIATRNAYRNRVADLVSFLVASPSQLATPQWLRTSAGFDVIVVNTLIGVHEIEGAALQSLASPAASLIITGVLEEQVERARAAYATFEFTAATVQDDWVLLTGTRG